MGYSDKSEIMALELARYWKLMNEGCERYMADPLDPVLDEIVDEIDLLREYTEWPALRTMCARALALEAKLRQPLLPDSDRRARSVM